jgi:oxygen-independent coproporphyrinogen-3 oxidase
MPWCVRKCPYCDFNSHKAADETPFGRYVDALVTDLREESERAADREVRSIFIGGGTPSLFAPSDIERVLCACRDGLRLADDCEITMEANPGTVEHGNLKGYRAAGVTRLSIGAQSFDAGMLQVLGRIHGPEDILATYRAAEAAGFDNINLDLMFALPGQDEKMAMADVTSLLALEPPHVSYYQLTLEPNTVFHARPPDGLPDDNLAWAMQLQGQSALTQAGYRQYEVSAFARPGHQCRHNLNYWQFGDYLAAGAGAHGKLTGPDGRIQRYDKTAHPMAYIEAIENGADVTVRPVATADVAFEFMLNALRLIDGFPGSLYAERTGHDLASVAEFEAALADGLIEASAGGNWRPTADGFRWLNDLQARFLR